MRRVAVTGSTGFLGQAVLRELHRQDYDVIEFGALNLMKESATHFHISQLPLNTPVIHLAYPGGDGIGDALEHPATIAMNLLRMDLNVIQACAVHHVPKLVCMGSVCSYPEFTNVPTTEEMLWAGYPEPVNASYGIVKRTQLALLQACRQEFKLNGIHLLLPNLYGPGDRTKHVIPALIGRMRLSEYTGEPLVVWGDPNVTRSFLYIDDAAAGIVRALEHYNGRAPLNLVNAGETTMVELLRTLERVLNYCPTIEYDHTRPTGHTQRNFSQVNMVRALDWRPTTGLLDGLEATVAWHRNEYPNPKDL